MPKPPTPPLPGAATRRSRTLAEANERLAALIASLQRDRDRTVARWQPEAPRAAPPAAQPSAAASSGAAAAGAAAAVAGPGPAEEPARSRSDEGLLRAQLEEIRQAHDEVCEALTRLQEQVAEASALLVALRCLHEAPDRAGVLAALQDVVVNVVGSEHLALYLPGPDGALAPALALGPPAALDPRALQALLEEDRLLVGAAAAGRLPGVAAVIPLRARGDPEGLLVLLELLPQKQRLGAADQEVLELVRLHAALALRASAGSAHAQG